MIVRKIAAAVGLAKSDPQLVLEHEADEPGRDRRDDQQHAEPRVGGRDASLARAAEQAADDLDPVSRK